MPSLHNAILFRAIATECKIDEVRIKRIWLSTSSTF